MGWPGLNLFDLRQGETLLERYRIDAALAHGPLSARFRVQDLETDEPKALEVFMSGLFEGHGQAAFFADRVRAFGKVTSSIALPTERIEVTEGGDVLRLSTWPQGQDLRTRLAENGPLSRSQAIQMGEALLEGVKAWHDSGFAHGDIKPSNLYLEEGGVKAAEGGVTAALWRAQHMGARTSLIGTPFYAPLEQFSGEVPGPGSDLYAIGTVLYEALSGALPWAGKGFIEVFQSKMADNPPPIESRAPNLRVGAALEEVIRRSIRARRDERFAGAQEFLEALRAARSAS